ncbi:MAG: UbiD family decarboxylase [Desulfurococcales archaeon]|jgi:UbiD family decarboxylase|nr:UbiD family decarboxylase [Desulfurococcales archaeon]
MPDIVEAVKFLEMGGLLYRVDKVLSWRFEAAKAIEYADSAGKAVIFRVDCCPGIDVVSNVIPSREVLKNYLDVKRDEDLYLKILDAMGNPLKCGEEDFRDHYEEDRRSLYELPALHFYEGDAGRYFTSAIFIARDPEEEIYNASIHRILVKDPMAGPARIVPRHLRRIIDTYRSKGRETPIAVCFSPHPVVFLSAALQPRYGVFEIEVANRLLRGSLKMCRTPIYNLPTPCECSHVLEGRISLQDVEEGPFADALLTYDRVRREPLVVFDKIYRSRVERPFHTVLPGRTEHTLLMGIGKEADIYQAVSRVVRRVYKVRLTRPSGGWLHAIISIEKGAEGEAKNAVLAAFAAHPSLKMVIVVDGDVDADNPEEVEWAIATRLQASRGVIIIRDARLSSLDPSAQDGVGDKLGIDATVPIKEREKYRRARIPGDYFVNSLNT